MSEPEKPQHRRIRRTKRLLRYMPRRAVFHRYPLIGRFAALARKEEHLWSFRPGPVRRALYFGAVLAFLPLMGVQLIVGLVLAVIFRTNYMVLGVLQLITNPFTAVPIYSATLLLGRRTLNLLGFQMRGARLPEGWHNMSFRQILHEIEVGTTVGHAIISLLVGGVLTGLIVAALLDAMYMLGRRGATAPARSSIPPGEDPRAE